MMQILGFDYMWVLLVIGIILFVWTMWINLESKNDKLDTLHFSMSIAGAIISSCIMCLAGWWDDIIPFIYSATRILLGAALILAVIGTFRYSRKKLYVR